MPNLQSELATRVFFVTQKEIWKINVQKDGERKSFYSKLPGKRGQKDCAAKAAAWLLSDARTLYPDSSLADLYDDLTMPLELRKAHQDNDRAVMDAYGFTKGTAARTSESACVAELMKLYQQKVSAAQSK